MNNDLTPCGHCGQVAQRLSQHYVWCPSCGRKEQQFQSLDTDRIEYEQSRAGTVKYNRTTVLLAVLALVGYTQRDTLSQLDWVLSMTWPYALLGIVVLARVLASAFVCGAASPD